METFDLVVVGAGWHGLAVAKTYHEVCPKESILVVDSAQSIGGTWAKERLYPGLKTNNILGSYEFGDFPMTPGKFNVKPGQHIPGAVVHDYLYKFAQEFDLLSRVRLQSKVESAVLQDDGQWLLRISSNNMTDSQSSDITAKRLVIATGLTSEPNIPTIKGKELLSGNFLHSREQPVKHKVRTSFPCATTLWWMSQTAIFALKDGLVADFLCVDP